jgi:hypothetical protein
MKSPIIAAIIAFWVLLTQIAGATDYRITATRKDSNTYQFTSGSVRGIITTKYCYEYAYSEDAVLKYEGHYGSQIIFLDSGNKCDVDEVYTK